MTSRPVDRGRALVGFAVRLSITIVALILILNMIDLQQLAATVARANAGLLLGACGLYLVAFFICSVRWYVLLLPTDPLPFKHVVRWFLIGAFFNTLLPTTIGGDVIRIRKAGLRIGSWSRAAATVLLDRVSGYIAITSIGLIATAASLPAIRAHPVILKSIGVVAILFVATAAALLSRRVFELIPLPIRWAGLRRWHAALEEFHHLLRSYGRHPSALTAAVAF